MISILALEPTAKASMARTGIGPIIHTKPTGVFPMPWNANYRSNMQPYTDEENEWVSTGQYRKSNLNRERQVREEDNRLYTRTWGIRTTIEVDGKEYVVPVQL